ncbi:MAG: hypothetical protein GY754_26500 [bacterium]|nr:hypothetical protein [bacterium]
MKIIFPEGNDRNSFDVIDIKEKVTLGILDEKITMGVYTAFPDRSGTEIDSSGFSIFFLSLKTVSAKQTYSFKLTGPDGFNWRGKCAANAEVEKERVKIFNFKTRSKTLQKNNLLGEFVSGNKKISLYMDGSYGRKTGYIQFNGSDYTIRMKPESSNMGGGWKTSNSTIGYQIYDKDVLIAVIGTTSMDKALYIRKGIDRELMPVLLNTSAALVAYEDISAEI